jgi:tripartite-type tricarboxylate transporter receptor subunit TctC
MGVFSRYAVVAALAALATWAGPAVAADAYLSRPIHFIVSFPPGGSADVVVRALQPYLERDLGQPIVVDNRPGAGGVIGVDAVAKAAPDGYVVGLGAAGALAVNVSLQQSMPFDPRKDLAPITRLADIPFLLITSASSPIKSLRDAIELAKAKPDAVSVGHGGNGTAMHLSAQLFNQMAQVRTSPVPYRGSSPVANDVLAGHIPLGVVDVTSAIALVKAGQVRALAVTTARRIGSLPDVPTFAEAGLPGYESVGWFGIVAPAGTPPEIIAKLNKAIVAALNDPEIAERARTVGVEPASSTPEEFARFIGSETEKWAKVVATSGAKAN